MTTPSSARGRRLIPLAESRLVIDNEFVPDLPRELWEGDEHTESIARAGQRLDELDLLPAPWPIDEMLSADELRHVSRLFGIGGLSYGNASARQSGDDFWMSASGVDKSRLREIGTEILLVTGFEPARGVIRLSVPPDVKPRRVSVDAIEHLTIYREHPRSAPSFTSTAGWRARSRPRRSIRAGPRSWPARWPSWCGGAGPGPRRDRPQEPRADDHRREPGRDPGAGRAAIVRQVPMS